ncbi:hypothetical protein KSU07_07755 [Fusobacterium animalis]|jgi:hypothetical protein|uniref:hypothetical protein n=1 Tax=Fusobacterium animalis TaxID=76859 RepID=UPI0030CC4A92
MLDKEIREKIVKIMELSIEVNGSDKYTVFTNYCGHINSFEINICYGKYSEENVNFLKENGKLKKRVYLDFPNVLKNLDEIIEELERLRTI